MEIAKTPPIISSTWEKDGAPADQLTIREVDEIPRLPSAKFQDMTSDFIHFPDFKPESDGTGESG